MSGRCAAILRHLEGGEQSASNLSRLLDVPEPSIRRDIQKLRAAGFNISFAGAGFSQLYRLGR